MLTKYLNKDECFMCKSALVIVSKKYLRCTKCNRYYQKNTNNELFLLSWNGPNSFPLLLRVFCIVISLGTIAYGIIGLIRNDIYLPARGSNHGIHFSGLSAIFIFISLLSFSSIAISILIDHYDNRNNEKSYEKYRKLAIILWLAFELIAIIIKIVQVIFESI